MEKAFRIDSGIQLDKEKLMSFKTPALIAAACLLAVLLLSSDMRDQKIAPPDISEVTETGFTEDYEVGIDFTVQEYSGLGVSVYLADAAEDVSEPDTLEWIPYRDSLDLSVASTGDYVLYARDGVYNITATEPFHVEVNAVTDVEINRVAVYMPLEDTASVSASIETVGHPDETITWSSSDPSVVSVDQSGNLTAGNVGTAVITAASATGAYAECPVTVSDLYTKTQLSGYYKQIIPPYRYTEEEAHLLDEALFYEVEEAGGYGTRAAVIAATRFLTLQFPYRIPYFFENGRLLNQDGRPKCDGEGRYYHRGLYLSTDKYADIERSVSGPAIWGVNITNYEDKYYFVRFQQYPNGLDCSGFITWCLYNGGFDLGDTGAGDFWYWDYDLCDYGEQRRLTVDLLDSGEVKAGDLIGEDGHIALIAGIDYDHRVIHVAESLAAGVKISSYSFYGCTVCGLYDFICLMDDVYGEQGNYTDMWEDAGTYYSQYYG